jgi:hypothetical protein
MSLLYEIIKDTGIHIYRINKITGKRSIYTRKGCYQPIDRGWLDTGVFTKKPGPLRHKITEN